MTVDGDAITDIDEDMLDLKIQKISIPREEIFDCNICMERLDSRDNMIKHWNQMHKQQNKNSSITSEFPCPDCSKIFRKNKSRREHMRLKHGYVRKRHGLRHEYYKCPHCPKEFKVRNSYLGHIRDKHLPPDKNIHNCPLCPKIFQYTSRYRQHMLNTHGVTVNNLKKKVYTCSYCGDKFDWRPTRWRHEQRCRLRHQQSEKVTKTEFQDDLDITEVQILVVKDSEEFEDDVNDSKSEINISNIVLSEEEEKVGTATELPTQKRTADSSTHRINLEELITQQKTKILHLEKENSFLRQTLSKASKEIKNLKRENYTSNTRAERIFIGFRQIIDKLCTETMSLEDLKARHRRYENSTQLLFGNSHEMNTNNTKAEEDDKRNVKDNLDSVDGESTRIQDYEEGYFGKNSLDDTIAENIEDQVEECYFVE